MLIAPFIGGLITLGTQVTASNAVEDAYRILKPTPTGQVQSFGVRAGVGIVAGAISYTLVNVVTTDLAAIMETMNEDEPETPQK